MEGPIFRFVILHHTGWISAQRGDHWDWMLESPQTSAEGLLSFAVPADPRNGWTEVLLEATPSHRSLYLDYEGPISQGRGQVKRVAQGGIRWLPSTAIDLYFELVHIEFLEPPFAPWPTGRYCLTCSPASPSTASPTWRLVRERKSE